MGVSHTLFTLFERGDSMTQNDDTKKYLKKQREIWRVKRLEEKEKYKKNERFFGRLTRQEKDFIMRTAKQHDCDYSTYMLEAALYCEVNLIQTNFLNEHTIEISRLGVNINQIARALNIKVKDGTLSKDDIGDIEKQLEEYNSIFEDLKKLNTRVTKKINNLTKTKSSHEFVFDDS